MKTFPNGLWNAVRPAQFNTVLMTAACFIFVAAVFIPGFRLAQTVVGNSSALQFVSEQRRHPLAVQSTLEAVQDRLNSRGYVQAPLDQLQHEATALSEALDRMSAPPSAGWFGSATETTALAQPSIRDEVVAVRSEWLAYRDLLQPVIGFHGLPFQDSESAGARLNKSGQQLAADVSVALRKARKTIPTIDAEFGKIGERLELSSNRAASTLSLIMLVGLAMAGALVLLVALLQIARRKQERVVREAQQQTESIFRTVKEGLFLLDRQQVIGTAHSAAMRDLFKRTDIAGLTFEALLKNIVPEKTLSTALKFVNVLWAERTNEKLVKSINPLGEVEVRFDADSGGTAPQYLEFDFHRVRTGIVITHLLVSVTDVSARVALAAELNGARERSQAQIDSLLALIRVDPQQLASFLADSDASLQMVNAILREPAREETAFRKKLDAIFRQIHGVKGEASAIGLSSIEGRTHSFEDDLRTLRDKTTLSGNDFLPLIVKLDDLFAHLQSIRDLVARLSALQPGGRSDGEGSTEPSGGVELGAVLGHLAERIARDHGKSARVQLTGLHGLPEGYRRVVKDIAIQAVRNAMVHGIEPPSLRVAAGKGESGLIQIELIDLGDKGYKLSLEDDGQGLVLDKLVATAVRRGIVSAEEAPRLATKQVIRLLFHPGFSTVEHASADAGRGVGMNLIASLVQQVGGSLGVATVPGKFTRFTVNLPALLHPPASQGVAR